MATPGSGVGRGSPGTICVDLDGTLVRTDTLIEGLLRLLHDPRTWAGLLDWLLRGRAALKRQVTARAPLDPTLLPYEHTLIDYLRAQRGCGRRLVLATAADRHLADGVNAHLRLFDEVIASDGVHNLKGRAKGDALAERFGADNFTYVGNSWPDLHIWRRAGSAVLVNAPDGLANEVARITTVERRIDDRPPRAASLLKVLRPHQWLKNVLVFLPILTANALRDGRAWVDAPAMFTAFCTTASAVYIVNDLTDLAADRAHPRKRRRPFASGDLPLVVGLAVAPLLLLAGGPRPGHRGDPRHHLLRGVLAGLLSQNQGAAAGRRLHTGAPLHPTRRRRRPGQQLPAVAFSIFLFLSLAIIKRVSELMDLKRREGRTTPRRGYQTDDIAILQAMGVGASFVSATVFALFVQSDSVAVRYMHPELLWVIVPLLLFWQCRLWLATARGSMHDDPIIYAARDRVSWLTIATILVVFILARGLDSRVG